MQTVKAYIYACFYVTGLIGGSSPAYGVALSTYSGSSNTPTQRIIATNFADQGLFLFTYIAHPISLLRINRSIGSEQIPTIKDSFICCPAISIVNTSKRWEIIEGNAVDLMCSECLSINRIYQQYFNCCQRKGSACSESKFVERKAIRRLVIPDINMAMNTSAADV
jgi:hypothetical protein